MRVSQPDDSAEEGRALALTREALSQCVERIVDPGNWAKAAVTICRVGSERVVVKDLRPMNRLVRWLYGNWAQRRELRNLRFLVGVPGVPRLRGRVDDAAFATEWIEGTHLRRDYAGNRFQAIFVSLESTIAAIHSRSVVHLDLHEKKNILIRPDNQAFLLDFESALYLGRFGLIGRLGFQLLRRLDRAALLKFKGRYAPHLLTDTELRHYRRLVWINRLWLPKRLVDGMKAVGSWLGLRRRKR